MTDVATLHHLVRQEIAMAREHNAPVTLFPLGPKSQVFAITFQLCRDYPEGPASRSVQGAISSARKSVSKTRPGTTLYVLRRVLGSLAEFTLISRLASAHKKYLGQGDGCGHPPGRFTALVPSALKLDQVKLE